MEPDKEQEGRLEAWGDAIARIQELGGVVEANFEEGTYTVHVPPEVMDYKPPENPKAILDAHRERMGKKICSRCGELTPVWDKLDGKLVCPKCEPNRPWAFLAPLEGK